MQKLGQYLVDKNFLSRLPKINIYQDQLKTLDKKTISYYKQFLLHKLKYKKQQEELNNFINHMDDYISKGEGFFLNKLKEFVNPQQAQYQYQREKMVDIKRGEQRARQFHKLAQQCRVPLMYETVCDIGCNNGIISKVIAKQFNVKQMDMFDPWIDEIKVDEIKLPKTNFYKLPFEERPDKTLQYDAIFLITTLHHILNPLKLMKQIKKSLKKGGYLFVREHLPKTEMQKRLLDVQEKNWTYGLNLEVDSYEKLMDGTHPPEAYFFESELYNLIGCKPVGLMPEQNLVANEWIHYFVFKMD